MILTHGANSLQMGYFVEIGGRKYPVVKIGNQLWMAENLDYKFDVNGSQIPIGRTGTSYSEPRANYYNNDESTYGINGNKYGLLYNWPAVNYLNQNKTTLLPIGWHVPSLSEWDALAVEVGGADIAAGKLKSLTDWHTGWEGTDDYGFSIHPCGWFDGSFGALGTNASLWTSDLSSSINAYGKWCGADKVLLEFNNYRSFCCSVRLVKDAT